MTTNYDSYGLSRLSHAEARTRAISRTLGQLTRLSDAAVVDLHAIDISKSRDLIADLKTAYTLLSGVAAEIDRRLSP